MSTVRLKKVKKSVDTRSDLTVYTIATREDRVGARGTNNQTKQRAKSVKHLYLEKGRDGYYRLEGTQLIAMCPVGAKRWFGRRRPRRALLILSLKALRGLRKFRFVQAASQYDPHNVWCVIGGFVRAVFKSIAHAVAMLKRWSSFQPHSGFIYVSVSPC